MVTEAGVRAVLQTVMDPEIPTASIVDLGMVEAVRASEDGVEVDLVPTFSGCPALDVIREDVRAALAKAGVSATVRFVTAPAWTTDRIVPAGRAALPLYGVSAPGDLARPFCGSTQTEEQSRIGPTPCRSIRYCAACRNPYEGFKPKLRA
jgi:ring-1,2-phenylacetyl-CoA epoxidase subunit PaaD